MSEVNYLQEIGINAGLVVSGLFGSLLTIKKGDASKLSSIVVSMTTGIGSANYITPIVVDALGVTNNNLTFGIAFILGFLGLRGIELVIEKFAPQLKEEPKPVKQPTRKKPVKRRTSNKT